MMIIPFNYLDMNSDNNHRNSYKGNVAVEADRLMRNFEAYINERKMYSGHPEENDPSVLFDAAGVWGNLAVAALFSDAQNKLFEK